MGLIVNTKPFDLNRFWEKMPTPLKYLLFVAIIVAGSYFLFAKKADTLNLKEIQKIELSISTTHQLVEKFEEFATLQTEYNEQVINDIRNIYILISELNDNVNTKFDILIRNSGQGNQDLLDKMDILNQSFNKISRAYQPTLEKIEPEFNISTKKIIKNEQ